MGASDSAVALLMRFRTDFKFYAPRALKVKNKAGEIVPFVLNKAQEYIHEKLEEQLARTGKVRALILKGRQQGACLSPDTRVLTADLRWVRIDSLTPGEQVVATDEHTHVLPNGEYGKGRKMRTATVQAVVHTTLPAYRITLDDGRQVVCSGLHRWLVRGSQTQWDWRSIEGSRPMRVGWKLRAVTTPWEDASLDDAWFGGMIDGEGSFERRRTTGGLRLAVSQRAGAVLDRMLSHCEARGYGAYVISDDGPRKTKLGQQPVHAVNVSSASTMFRLMGLSRPTRFIHRHWWDGLSMPDNGERTIVSIEPVGTIPLVDIQTSTGTFLAEGIVSHNSTYIGGRFYWKTSGEFGKQTFILTHEQSATDNLFAMTKRYHNNCPDTLKPQAAADNAKELWFNVLDSRYKVATAGAKATGRSATAQYFHGSEVAFWPNAPEHMAGIGQTVPNERGTEIILETTANGIGQLFHRLWVEAQRGESDYLPIFVPWFWQDEYRVSAEGVTLDAEELTYQSAFGLDLEQMAWRRSKIKTDFAGDTSLFNQEYPATPEMAFMRGSERGLISPELVTSARRPKPMFDKGAKILGVDPAEYGSDKTAIVFRWGRKVVSVERYAKKGSMEVAGIVARMIDEIEPDAIIIDVTGVGTGVADRLIEQGFDNIYRVHFGGKAYEDTKYLNRRAECWGNLLEWLKDEPCLLPDDDQLQADLTSVPFHYDSSRRMVLESKEKLKRDGIPSPDSADALALTFAERIAVKTPEVSWRQKLRQHARQEGSAQAA